MAHETGTQAVMRSPHFERLTPRVSRRGLDRLEFHRTTEIKEIRKKQIRKTKTNQTQYQY